MKFSALCCVLIVATLPVVFSRLCVSTSQCQCGEICVRTWSRSLCSYGDTCTCRRGCGVAYMFLPAGTSNRDVYCNSCSCPRNSAGSRSIPSCTRRAWCGLPRRAPLYPGTVNCITMDK